MSYAAASSPGTDPVKSLFRNAIPSQVKSKSLMILNHGSGILIVTCFSVANQSMLSARSTDVLLNLTCISGWCSALELPQNGPSFTQQWLVVV